METVGKGISIRGTCRGHPKPSTMWYPRYVCARESGLLQKLRVCAAKQLYVSRQGAQ